MAENPPTDGARHRPGPRRRKGAPTGPEAVTRAILDAAADLFARHGVSEVSLRDIARAADVQVSLIGRYIGSRDELIDAVFDDLTSAIGDEVVGRPLEQISFERDSAMGRWTALLTHLASTGHPLARTTARFNPVDALAQVIEQNYGADPVTARLRGAQIVASALGWRIFEDYLLAAGALEGIGTTVLRDELTALHRRIGATPWPSPPDPATRQRRGTA